MEYQWDINGNLGEYPPVSWPAWLESSPCPYPSMIEFSHKTKAPRLGDFGSDSGKPHLPNTPASRIRPSAISSSEVATSPSQHCYSVGLYRKTGVTPGCTNKKIIHPGNVRSSFLCSSYLPLLDTIECSKILTERNESWKCLNCPC